MPLCEKCYANADYCNHQPATVVNQEVEVCGRCGAKRSSSWMYPCIVKGIRNPNHGDWRLVNNRG